MKTYPLFKVHVPAQEALVNIKDVLASGYVNEGIQVSLLTQQLQDVLGTSNLVLTNSCTSALVLALRISGVGPGTDVVTTPMTCVATNAAIASLGARIVWADVDPRDGMLDPDTLYRYFTPNTKAVVVVAWAGNVPQLFGLSTICSSRGIKLILDAAHAFGAEYMEKPIHEFVDCTAFSFQAIKHFTTGDGGGLVCRDANDHKRAKSLKWFGMDRDRAKDAHGNWRGQQWDVDIEEIGYKFNMNNLSAAVGLANVPYIDEVLGKHRCNADTYDQLFRDFHPVQPNRRVPGSVSSHWVYAMQVNPLSSRLTRDELLQQLNAEGIMAGVVHVPNDDYTCFNSARVELPGVRDFAKHQFALPCGWWLDEDDVRYIADRVKKLTW